MSVTALTRNEAFEALADETFGLAWDRLYAACPWATAFQTRSFATTWYQLYREKHSPLIVVKRTTEGQITGLLPLAVGQPTGDLIVAGGQDAEYQVWLAEPDQGATFPPEALVEAQRQVPSKDLTFRYIPPGTPVDWLVSAEAAHIPYSLEIWPRPIMNLADWSNQRDRLRKKSNKSRLNRLKRIGELRFEHITQRDEFERVFDTIIDFYDLRQGAVHDGLPFRQDALKRQLLLDLLDRRDLLHATVLKVGDSVAAAHIGLASRNSVHLGTMAHSPYLAEHSPGKLHLLMLARLLAAQGRDTLDLTPGGDPYKERFADDHDQTHVLTVFASRGRKLQDAAIRGAESLARVMLKSVRITPKKVKAAYQRLRRTKLRRVPTVLVRQAGRKVWHNAEYRIYSYSAVDALEIENPGMMARDEISHLLAYTPAEGWQTRKAFLARALRWLETGMHVYTFIENGRLAHYGWVKENPGVTFFTEVHQEFRFPPGSTYLTDSYTFPDVRGRGMLQASLRQELYDAAHTPGVERIFVGVLADNGPSRHVIEKIGFTYMFSGYEKTRFCARRHWMDVP